MIIFKDRQLHLNRPGQAVALADQRTLSLHIVIDRRVQYAEALREADVFQIEHEVLAPADFRVHLQMVLFNNLPPVQLIPEYAVIEIRRVFHHVGGELLSRHAAVLLDIPLLGDALSRHPVKIRDHQIAAVLLGHAHQELRGVRRDPVVAVGKLKIGSPGVSHRQVPGRRHAAVFLMDHADPHIPRGVLVADGAGAILAAVVDEQQLEIRILLPEYAVHAAPQIFLRIVNRHNNGNHRVHSFSFFSHISYTIRLNFFSISCFVMEIIVGRPWGQL